MRLLVIGGGNMGLTYAKGIHNSNLLGESIMVLEKGADNISKLKSECPEFEVYENAEACVAKADFILMAVKPFHAQEVFNSIAEYTNQNQLLISVMAGVKIETIQNGLGLSKIVRSMPNLPAMINKGMTGYTASKEVNQSELETVQKLLASTGASLEVASEDHIDKITGLSGSGSAYIFYFMEAMINSAKEMGFTEEEAKLITCQTFEGAVDLFKQNETSTKEWIEKVSSKGGTTVAAIDTFNESEVNNNIKKGIFAAYNRAVELGNS